MAATDPANPYGSILPWPPELHGRPERAPGARVILRDGRLIGFLSRSGKHLSSRLSEDHVQRRGEVQDLFAGLVEYGDRRGLTTLLLEHIDGQSAPHWLEGQGLTIPNFHATSAGLFFRRQVLQRAEYACGGLHSPIGSESEPTPVSTLDSSMLVSFTPHSGG